MAASSSSDAWASAQKWERSWWLTARHMHAIEQAKNGTVAKLLLIDGGTPYRTVIDIGCGPLSLLLRVPTARGSVALDPLVFDDLEAAYEARGVRRLVKCGEDLTPADGHWDEAWIYNCLQHVKSPDAVLRAAMAVADTVRIFEWTHLPPYEGHLWELTPELLATPFARGGWSVLQSATGWLDHDGLNGTYFAAIFSRVKRDVL